MSNYTEVIGKKIKEFRLELGDTQSVFAEKLGVNRSSLSLIENGTQAPDFDVFAKFLTICRKDIYELLEISYKKHIVVDTNVILNCPNIFSNLKKYCDYVYIPKEVVKELNNFKDNGSSAKKRLAGLCMDKLNEEKCNNFYVDCGTTNEVIGNSDDKIFAFAMEIAEKNKADDIYLLTNDKDFKLKDIKKNQNLKIINSLDLDVLFNKSHYNIPRSQRFYDLVQKMDIEQLKKYDLSGVDVNFVDSRSGYTPLISAIRKKNIELIKFLLDLPYIDINCPDNQKYCFPPISHAIQLHRIDIINLLLEYGANVDEPSYNEKNSFNTPLMIAAWGGNLNEVKLLIDNGASINQQDKGNGYTPLIKAVIQNHIEIVEYLIQKGADILIYSFQKRRALDYAYEKNNKKIINLLNKN